MHTDPYGVHSGIEADSFKGLAKETKASLAFLPAVLRKRSIFSLWLTSARRAWMMLASTFVVMLLLFPPVVRMGLRQMYPPVVHQTVFSRVVRPDPRAVTRERAAIAIGWAIGLASAAIFLSVHLPIAVVRAGALSRDLERDADEKRSLAPGRAAEIYARALRYASDPAQESLLQSKLASARKATHVSPVHAAPARA